MSERSDGRVERRRHPRIAPKGSLTFRAGEYEQRGRLVNLCVGGAYVETSVKPPDRLLRRKVEVDLRLDAGYAEWLRTTASVVRIRPDGLALAFDALPEALVTLLDDMATASSARARVIAVVLIDEDAERRSAMAAGFRSTGCLVVEASSPLEAIVRLGESSFEPDVIAIANTGDDAAAQMRTFVEREHPRVKLITIGDELLRPDGFANWLSSANPDADLPERVRDALVAPYRRR